MSIIHTTARRWSHYGPDSHRPKVTQGSSSNWVGCYPTVSSPIKDLQRKNDL
ncbi:hypothetical protein BgiBS90_027057, partial [Biomphalaria glabrata]